MTNNPIEEQTTQIPDQIENIKVNKNPRRFKNHVKKYGKKYGLGTIALIFILGLFLGVNLVLIYNKAQSIKTQALAIPHLLLSRDFSQAASKLANLNDNFSSVQKYFNHIKFFEATPLAGKQLKAAHNLIDAGAFSSQAAEGTAIFLSAVPFSQADDVTYKEIDYSSREMILKKVIESPEEIVAIIKNIQVARAKLAEIPEKGVASLISNNAKKLDAKLALAEKVLLNAEPLLKVVPELTGFNEEKNYLFLLLNNDELRPTGGFVSAYSVLNIKNGTVTNLHLDDTWNLDKKFVGQLNNQAPAPMAKYNYSHPWYPNTTGEWFFRDMTWSPDFITVAPLAEASFLREAKDLGIDKNILDNLDGVIAITPTFVNDLLELSGDLKVREYFIAENNLADILEYESHIGHIKAGLPESERKKLILQGLIQMFNNLFDLKNENWPNFLSVAFDNLNEKHILIYSKNPEIQNELVEMSWAGQVKSAPGDYLLVTDANLASLKDNRFLDRTINYQIMPDANGKLIAKVEITYKYYGEPNWKITKWYSTYTTIYAPLGSKLIKVTNNMDRIDQGEDLGKQWFATYIRLNTGEEKTLTFEYELSPTVVAQIKNGEYQLLAQKQNGTVNDYLKLNLNFGQKIKSAAPVELKEFEADNFYQQSLKFDTDLDFNIRLK